MPRAQKRGVLVSYSERSVELMEPKRYTYRRTGSSAVHSVPTAVFTNNTLKPPLPPLPGPQMLQQRLL